MRRSLSFHERKRDKVLVKNEMNRQECQKKKKAKKGWKNDSTHRSLQRADAQRG